jgi:hypothetical protein
MKAGDKATVGKDILFLENLEFMDASGRTPAGKDVVLAVLKVSFQRLDQPAKEHMLFAVRPERLQALAGAFAQAAAKYQANLEVPPEQKH